MRKNKISTYVDVQSGDFRIMDDNTVMDISMDDGVSIKSRGLVMGPNDGSGAYIDVDTGDISIVNDNGCGGGTIIRIK